MKTLIKSATILFGSVLLSTGAFAAGKTTTDSLANEISTSVIYYSDAQGINVNVDNATKGDTMVTIYNEDGKVVLTDKFANATDKIKKSYKLDNIADGDYTVAVSVGDNVAVTSVSLDSEDIGADYYTL